MAAQLETLPLLSKVTWGDRAEGEGADVSHSHTFGKQSFPALGKNGPTHTLTLFSLSTDQPGSTDHGGRRTDPGL